MTVSNPELPGSEVVFTRDRAGRRPLVQRGTAAVVFSGLAAAASLALGPPGLVIAGLFGAYAVGCAAAYVAQGIFRTALRPDGIHIRHYRTRCIPWTDVAGFRVHGPGEAASARPGAEAAGAEPAARIELGFRGPTWDRNRGPAWDQTRDRQRGPRRGRVTVRVIRARGGTITLPAPVVTGDVGNYRFADELRELEQWRDHYGGRAVGSAIR